MESTITIRDAEVEDAQRLLEIYAYYVKNTAITFEYEVPARSEFQERIRNTMRRYPYLVAERNGVIHGYAFAGPFVGRAAYDWSCEMTVYLDRAAQKCGLGRILYEALEDRLREMGACRLHVSTTAAVMDRSGLYKNPDGTARQYFGHASWIYFFNNETACDQCSVDVWHWMARQLDQIQ